jgi:hypothetical protein
MEKHTEDISENKLLKRISGSNREEIKELI